MASPSTVSIAEQRLFEVIGDQNHAEAVAEVIRCATHALSSLSHLDREIFERRTESGALHVDVLVSNPQDVERALSFLGRLGQHLWNPTMYLAQLIEHRFGERVESAEDSMDLDNLDFDMGFGEMSGGSLSAIGDSDIEDAFGALARDEPQKVGAIEVGKAIVPLGQALLHEIQTAEGKLETSISERDPRRAVQVLDACREVFEEAIFAVLEAVFRVHSVDIPREDIVPGYRSALQEAIDIRRGTSALRRVAQISNDQVQSNSTPIEDRQDAYQLIADSLSGFISTDVFVMMRAADRWQLLRFTKELAAAGGPDEGRLVCEGFAKYLESLGAINDRQVLVEHDRTVFRAIRGCLEAADSLASVSPSAAFDQNREALKHAEKLAGWRDELDDVIQTWARSERTESDAKGLVARLEEIIPES